MKNIAILGGGPSALSAAWELTRYPGWEEHYRVTVYQLGWTLGGKAASTRGRCDRIEEHGIHVLMGWYDQTFAMMNEVYAERLEKGLSPKSPYKTFLDACGRCNGFLLTDPQGPSGVPWVNWPVVAPENDAIPGNGPPPPPWTVIKELIGLGLELILGSPYSSDTDPIEEWILSWFYPDTDEPSGLLGRLAARAAEAVADFVSDETKTEQCRRLMKDLVAGIEGPPLGATADHATHRSHDLLKHILVWIENQVAAAGDAASRDLMLIELMICNLAGILHDVWKPAAGKLDYSAIDHLDYREWLSQYHASERVLASSVVRFFYSGTFSNVNDGDVDGGQFAAGAALQSIILGIGYKGSFVFTLKAGTGDTLMSPLYQVLQARGVNFEFFRRVTKVHPSTTGAIEQVDLAVQALVARPPYSPLHPVTVAGGEIDAWPSEPFYGQLAPGGGEAPTQTLIRGRDFDELILAIPVAEVARIASEIVEQNPAWQRTVKHVTTTATQAFQLWLKPSFAELGLVAEDWGMGGPSGPINTEVYANIFPCLTDMTDVLVTESWPAEDAPASLVYICGPMPGMPIPPAEDEGAARQLGAAEVRASAKQWVTDNLGWFFPRGTTREMPFGLNPELLAVPPGLANHTQRDRWNAQYFTANVEAWNRYTLTPPGSVRSRIRFDQSGFSNLVLAGDWVGHSGMNAGYLDGAVTCGVQAARAVRTRAGLGGHPPLLVQPGTFDPTGDSAE